MEAFLKKSNFKLLILALLLALIAMPAILNSRPKDDFYSYFKENLTVSLGESINHYSAPNIASKNSVFLPNQAGNNIIAFRISDLIKSSFSLLPLETQLAINLEKNELQILADDGSTYLTSLTLIPSNLDQFLIERYDGNTLIKARNSVENILIVSYDNTKKIATKDKSTNTLYKIDNAFILEPTLSSKLKNAPIKPIIEFTDELTKEQLNTQIKSNPNYSFINDSLTLNAIAKEIIRDIASKQINNKSILKFKSTLETFILKITKSTGLEDKTRNTLLAYAGTIGMIEEFHNQAPFDYPINYYDYETLLNRTQTIIADLLYSAYTKKNISDIEINNTTTSPKESKQVARSTNTLTTAPPIDQGLVLSPLTNNTSSALASKLTASNSYYGSPDTTCSADTNIRMTASELSDKSGIRYRSECPDTGNYYTAFYTNSEYQTNPGDRNLKKLCEKLFDSRLHPGLNLGAWALMVGNNEACLGGIYPTPPKAAPCHAVLSCQRTCSNCGTAAHTQNVSGSIVKPRSNTNCCTSLQDTRPDIQEPSVPDQDGKDILVTWSYPVEANEIKLWVYKITEISNTGVKTYNKLIDGQIITASRNPQIKENKYTIRSLDPGLYEIWVGVKSSCGWSRNSLSKTVLVGPLYCPTPITPTGVIIKGNRTTLDYHWRRDSRSVFPSGYAIINGVVTTDTQPRVAVDRFSHYLPTNFTTRSMLPVGKYIWWTQLEVAGLTSSPWCPAPGLKFEIKNPLPPSPTPSRSPSQAPSRTPSQAPSRTPSQAPSRTPSQAPSRTPSQFPSSMPSFAPTIIYR